MLDVFLEKLEVENADLLYVQYPSMVEAACSAQKQIPSAVASQWQHGHEVYESIQEDSVDHDELDDIPRQRDSSC